MIIFFPFIFTFVCMFGLIVVVFGLIGESLNMGIATLLLISVFSTASAGFVVLFASEKAGALFIKLIFGRLPGKSNLNDRLYSEYEIARRRKEEARFGEALYILEETLRKSPEFPHALCLKAQILWEGYRNFSGTKRYLRRAMQVLSKDDDLYRWASGFYDELVSIEEMRQADHKPPSEAGA